MNLRQKQKQFETLKNSGALDPHPVDEALEADFKATKRFTEAVNESFTQYQYRSTNEAIIGGLQLLALGNAHKAAHYRLRQDTHYNSTARHFKAVAQDLGFEQVGRFRTHRKDGRRDHTFVMARPDGLVLTWNTYGYAKGVRKDLNDAKLTYQYTGPGFPEGASGGYRESIKGACYFSGSNSVCEGLRETVNRLAQSGKLIGVWHKAKSDFDAARAYTLEQDYSHQREQDPAIAERGIMELGHRVDAVNRKRRDAMPLWVRQMTGEAPLKAPKPV